MRIYYSPQIARRSHVLELDYVRVLFGSRPQLSGPEELLATIVLGHL